MAVAKVRPYIIPIYEGRKSRSDWGKREQQREHRLRDKIIEFALHRERHARPNRDRRFFHPPRRAALAHGLREAVRRRAAVARRAVVGGQP